MYLYIYYRDIDVLRILHFGATSLYALSLYIESALREGYNGELDNILHSN